jgi:endonuclease YncB( thermonuclease family)
VTRRALLRAWLLALCLLSANAAPAGAPLEKVIRVSDGDTVTVQGADGAKRKVRLGEIDSPEHGQPYGDESRRELAGLVAHKYVRLDVQDRDEYGRTVARVWVGSLDVNAEMVKRGAAWAYRKYVRDPKLVPLEREARDAKRGLWALPSSQRVPPWKWRKSHRH